MLVGRWWLVPRPVGSGNPLLETMRPGLVVELRRLGLGLAVLLVASLGAVLARQLREFRDPFASLGEDLSLLLTGTSWGTSWMAALWSAGVVVVGLALAGRWNRTGWIMATLGALALAAFPARTGHANGVETLRWLTLAADAIHVLAAGLWMGGLGVLLFLVSRLRKRESEAVETAAVPRMVDSFSYVARMGVALLVVTGLFASWQHLPGIGALFGTAYGRTLVLKLVVVAAALSLGWWNWKRVSPRLTGPDGRAALTRFGTFEFVVAQIILLVTAMLVRLSPSGMG